MSTSSSYAVSPWLTCYQPQPQAQLRLFCFPHGGGGPQIYRDWAKALPDQIEVFALNLPGRGSRRAEPAITQMDDLAATIVTALKGHLDKPIAFFGHSVGALVCFETARRLRAAGLPLPIRLLVSAHKAPHESLTQQATYSLPDAELVQFIRSLGLVPDDVLDNEELVQFILPPIKADFEVSETYQYQEEPPLSCPISALGGTQDGAVAASDLEAWRGYTAADFFVQLYDGDHFYTQSQEEALLRDIQTLLLADLKHLPLSIVEGEQSPYPEKCLHELFREQAKQHPDEVAIADPHQQLTFRELDECTDLLARHLQRHGTVVDSIVGIYMESSVEYVIAYLSILKAGGGYMTLETAYPEALLQRALTKAEPVFVLTKKAWGDRLPSDWQTPDKILALDTQWQTKLQQENLPPLDHDRALPTPDNLAYCVMTSGTTGQPKVILAPHRGAVNSYYWRYHYHPYEPGEREACNVFFVWEVIRAILQGHSSYVIPDEVIYDPWKLVEFLETYQITRVLFTPSLLEQVLNTPKLDLETRLHHLNIVWLNGEVVPTELRNRFFKRLPNIKLLNDYSISECHDVCTYDLADLDLTLFPKYTTVGFPMSNVYLYLLDNDLKPVPQGMLAEIYVGGDSLAIGYLNDPEKTAERFVLDPIRNDGSRLFRTGDLGRIAADGTLEIKGRVQFMIKLRGYSIVLSAVETTIIDHPAVNSAVVLTKDNPDTQQPEALVAYIVGNGTLADGAIGQELRRYLKNQLPHYAIPSYFIPIQELPLNDVTGKLDRKKLPHPDTVVPRPSTPGATTTPVPTTTTRLSTLEQIITDAWETVLHVRSSDATDNFFDLGGHSLLAIQMCTALSEQLNVTVSVIDVYEYPTVRSLAQFLQPQVKGTLVANLVDGEQNGGPTSTVSQGLSQGLSQGQSRTTSTTIASTTIASTAIASTNVTSTDIAIIGMACRFPGANDPETFWQNLANGVCSIRELSEAELEENGIPPAIYQDEN
ncbi:MAG: alpha/beta fold hydrolase, partial [Leptolyngbyaceae cyanobacterium]